MGCGFDTLGTGVAINDTSAYKIYYTQDFGCSRQDYDCTCPEVSFILGSAGMSSIFEARGGVACCCMNVAASQVSSSQSGSVLPCPEAALCTCRSQQGLSQNRPRPAQPRQMLRQPPQLALQNQPPWLQRRLQLPLQRQRQAQQPPLPPLQLLRPPLQPLQPPLQPPQPPEVPNPLLCAQIK